MNAHTGPAFQLPGMTAMGIVCLVAVVSACQVPGRSLDVAHTIDDEREWAAATHSATGVAARPDNPLGGNFDVLGDGALMLEKANPELDFWHDPFFRESGTWTSVWLDMDGSPARLEADVQTYGAPQDFSSDWTKFSGNPLVAPAGWKHASPVSLLLPDSMQAQDQALVRGSGVYEGKWLLLFNLDPWATGGWAAAVADSLAPLKRGENPFRLISPYPLTRGTAGENAPNDWIEMNGTWYAPDESRDGVSRMWTSRDLVSWSNQGPIEGLVGHDPGIVWDGRRFYLFAEDDTRIQYASTSNPLGAWLPHGIALEVGDHTGDPDVAYFNNAWHLFFDDAPHEHYMIGYATTSPADFPVGWRLVNDIFGPRRPDQGQLWDEDTPEGNQFGTGDPDIAVEDQTLYMTYERPVGIAFRELDLTDTSEQRVRIVIEVDSDGDGTVDATSATLQLSNRIKGNTITGLPFGRVRLNITLETSNPSESPMLTSLRLYSR